jgi:hypothetical protein
MATPFITAITLIEDGQPVSAAITNVPIEQLAQNTRSLLEDVTAQSTGAMLVDVNATFQPGVVVGNLVYKNADGTYHLALSQLGNTQAGSTAAASAYVAGLVLNLTSSTTGTVCLYGHISTTFISEGQWAAVIDGGTWSFANFYLSAVNPGQMSTTVDPLAISVGSMYTDGSFLFKPAAPVFGAHVHEFLTLQGTPAGTVNSPSTGQNQVITAANPSLQGWLPISSFVGTAPVGAQFWYNISQSAEGALRAAFPPVPTDSAVFSQGDLILDPTVVQATDAGIFWMTNTYGTAPWPVDYNTTMTALPVYAWWNQVLAATSNSVVQSLVSASTSVLQAEFVGPGGSQAASGPLQMLVTQILANTSTTDLGVTAVKSITGGGFTSGPVTSVLLPGAGVTMNSSNGNATAGYYGAVTVSSANTNDLQGNADSVFLNGADFGQTANLSVVRLLNGRNQSPIFSWDISRFAPASSTMTFKVWLYSDTTGTVPSSVTLQYLVVPPTTTNTALPSAFTSVTSFAGQSVVASQALELTISPSIPGVTPGSIVLFQITRNAVTSDGFAGNLSIIRAGYTLA